MQPTIKAILARFKGDKLKAIDYCLGIADQHRHLRPEYIGLVDLIRTERKQS